MKVMKLLPLVGGDKRLHYWEPVDIAVDGGFGTTLRWTDQSGNEVDIWSEGIDVDNLIGIDRAFFFLKKQKSVPVRLSERSTVFHLTVHLDESECRIRWIDEHGREVQMNPTSEPGIWYDHESKVYHELP